MCAVLAAFALSAAAASIAFAQQPAQAPAAPGANNQGFSRIQGGSPTSDALTAPVSEEVLLDLREEMRNFVISIARFGRRFRRNFRVVAHGGLDLLVKRDALDENRTSPARAYVRALDGVVAEGMFFTKRRPGTPPPPERQAQMLRLADFAKRNGVRVFALDYGNGKRFVDQARAEAQKRGFVSLVTDRPLIDMAALPAYPRRPFGENSQSVITLGQVRNFIAVINSLPFGREDAFAMALHGTNYDMVIVDVFHGRRPLSRRAVETLKYKKIGAKRLVLARMDVGSAASYRYYWKDGWGEGSPAFVNAPHRGDPDRYRVKYWRPGWQKLIAGDANSYLYGIIRQGFDGVLLDGLDAYKFFEGGGEEEQEEEEERQ